MSVDARGSRWSIRTQRGFQTSAHSHSLKIELANRAELIEYSIWSTTSTIKTPSAVPNSSSCRMPVMKYMITAKRTPDMAATGRLTRNSEMSQGKAA